MGQIANCQYVCDAINRKAGTSLVPAAGTATQIANTEYLLKMIDRANRGATSHGTGGFATGQIADVTAVNDAVNRLLRLGKFITVAYNVDKAAYSANGINWTATTMSSLARWRDLAYGNGKFVAVAESGNNAAYSVDGVKWTAATLPSNANWRGVAYGDGKFVAVAEGSNKAAYSVDGVNWTAATLPSSAYWTAAAYG